MWLLFAALYLVTVGFADWWAYERYHQRWLRRERARTTLGVLLVFAPTLPLVLAGALDALTLAVLFCGFGVAGAVTVFRDIQGQTEGADKLREQILQ